jgi:hypothetical protein
VTLSKGFEPGGFPVGLFHVAMLSEQDDWSVMGFG